ncbi:MAG: phosphoribosyl-ATP pyrophosphohydrolase [Thermofilum sp. ex4484_79]|nr:MAG: phosphoribosyl-ATP pyrophosphohydrolase [Thermofilum sp. ex4484_79]
MKEKLVRDNIPQIIKDMGKIPVTRIASEEEFWEKLKEKLKEEIEEFLENEKIEELADILQVIYEIAKLKGISLEELEAVRKRKEKERGGFNKRIILVEIKNRQF